MIHFVNPEAHIVGLIVGTVEHAIPSICCLLGDC